MYDKDISEVVKEYVMFVDGLEHSVKARITKSTDQERQEQFYWEISHYYAGTESAQPYFPGKRTAKSLEDAKRLLMPYMKGFTTIKVEPNKRY